MPIHPTTVPTTNSGYDNNILMLFKTLKKLYISKIVVLIFFIKLYTINIETINYKSKNPQVNLMGSNPNTQVDIFT